MLHVKSKLNFSPALFSQTLTVMDTNFEMILLSFIKGIVRSKRLKRILCLEINSIFIC